MDQQAAALLGADMSLASRQPFTPTTEALIDSLGGVQARQVAFNSMIYLPKTQSTRLAQIRALAGPFPFYGELKTAPAEAAQSFRTQPHALVDEALMVAVWRGSRRLDQDRRHGLPHRWATPAHPR